MKNINIKNVSSTILSTALAITLITTSMTGCTKDFRYVSTKENGEQVVQAIGTMDFKTAESLKVIEIKIHNDHMLFLARKTKNDIRLKEYEGVEKRRYQYWDVFDDFKIIELKGEAGQDVAEIDYEVEEVDFLKEESLKKYLDEYGYKQKEYSVNELESIFEKIKDNYQYTNDKTLVKK